MRQIIRQMRSQFLSTAVLGGAATLIVLGSAGVASAGRCGLAVEGQWRLAGTDLARACDRGADAVKDRLRQHAEWLGHVAPDVRLFATRLAAVSPVRCRAVVQCAPRGAVCKQESSLRAKISEAWSCVKLKLDK